MEESQSCHQLQHVQSKIIDLKNDNVLLRKMIEEQKVVLRGKKADILELA